MQTSPGLQLRAPPHAATALSCHGLALVSHLLALLTCVELSP
jgi:hypothetical protein